LDWAREKDIPVIIFSSSGVGTNTIKMVFERYGIKPEDYPNLKIVSNVLKFDEDGKFVGVEEPIIHSWDKNLGRLRQKLPKIDEILKNADVLVAIGDNLGDKKVAEGFDGEVFGICFAPDDIRQECEKIFEVVLPQREGTFEDVVRVIEEKVLS